MLLFHADPASEEWLSYLEHVDEVVVEGLFGYINHSLLFFVDSMEAWSCQSPLFEAQMMLNGSGLTFHPLMNRDVGDGLYELIEGLIEDIFKTTVNVSRVASHLRESYQVLDFNMNTGFISHFNS